MSAAHKQTAKFRVKAIHLALASALTAVPAYANPTSPTVVNGNVTMSTSGNTLTVTNSPGAIIHWQQFSINAGETTRFIQQSSSSSVLNRVTGGNVSQILGTLQSNGKVFLINPAGIVFGANAVVNVAGLVASSLDISTQDFLDGKMKFAATDANAGKVSNAGNIETPNGGFVYIVAPKVENTGVITTPSGEAILAAGHSVELVDSMNTHLRVVVNAPTSDVNLSQIIANANGDIYQVLNSGKISANTAVVGENGRIYLKSAGKIETTSISVIEAKGDAAADGGSIVAFAGGDGVYAGSFDASGSNGGFIETSGSRLDFSGVSINASALTAGGEAGTWLLDPGELTVDASAASIISAALSGGTNVSLETFAAYGGGCTGPGTCNSVGTGNIIFNNASITASYGGYATTLSVDAYNDIVFQGSNSFLSSGAGLNLNLNTGFDSGPGANILSSGALTLNATGSGNLVVNLADTEVWTNSGLLNLNGKSQIDLKAGGVATFNNASGGVVNIVNNTANFAFFSDSANQDGVLNNNGIFNISGSTLTSLEAKFNNGPGGVLSIANGTLSLQNADVLSGQIIIGSGATINISEAHGGQRKFDNAVIVNNGGTLTSIVPYTFNNSMLVAPGNLIMPGGSPSYTGFNQFIAAGNINLSNLNLSLGDDAFFFAGGSIDISGSTLSATYDLDFTAMGNISVTNNSNLYAEWIGLSSASNPLEVASYVDAFEATNTEPNAQYFFDVFNLWKTTGDVTISNDSSVSGYSGVDIAGRNVLVQNSSYVSGDEIFVAAKDSLRIANDSKISAYSEMLAVVGGAIKLESQSAITVGSYTTLYFAFPYLTTGGWFVDGVEGGFGTLGQFGYCASGSSCISVVGGLPVLNENFFAYYGGGQTLQSIITQSLYNPDSTLLLASGDDDDEDDEGGDNQDQPRECS